MPIGAHACPAEEPRGGAHVGFVERAQLLAAEVQASADLAHEVKRHDAIRLHPEIGVAVALGHGLPRDLEDVPEARGDDQAERADLALQQRVGGDGGAVGEAGDVVRRAAGFGEDRVDAAHQADGGIGGRAGDLGDPHRAGAAIDRNDIGEGAAGIDADPQPGLSGRCRHLACAPRRLKRPVLADISGRRSVRPAI